MKQSSLLSFFSKAKPKPKPAVQAVPVTPQKEKQLVTPVSSSPTVKAKENIAPKTVSVETPKSAVRKSAPVPSSPLATMASGRRVKKVNYSEDTDDEDVVVGKRKRRRVVAAEEDDESDLDFERDVEMEKEEAEKDNAMEDEVVEEEDDDDDVVMEDDDDDLIEIEPPKKKKSKKTSTSALASKFSAGSHYKPAKKTVTKKAAKTTPQSKFAKENEERYQWLIHVKDAEGREETDPEYDPRTLYIPQSAWAKFTPFEKQYWEIKAKMFDTVVFFKKGKFFEVYENDADIAHQKFDLKLAGTGRANMRLAGIPESHFEDWARRFVAEGYKVAKVQQKESALAKEMKGDKKKVCERELECVLTCGTLTDGGMLTDDMANYCLALKEVGNEDGSKTFGVCFVDTATDRIEMTEFQDDPECSKLETLLAQVQPTEILVEKGHVSALVMKLLRFNAHAGAMFNSLKSRDEFWDHLVAYEELTRGRYFAASDLDDLSHYPSVLVQYHQQEKNVAFSAFGALLWYLRSLKLDKDTVSMGNFGEYDPFRAHSTMRLDGVTLQNLEVFCNSFDQSDKGTLFRLVNRGVTAFGKRMFRSWVMHPLLDVAKLNSRLDSVELLMNDGDLRSVIESKLAKLPDLERLVARVHSGNLKVAEFTKVISGFETILSLKKAIGDNYGSSLENFLGEVLDQIPPSLGECTAKWSNAFDRNLAYTEGTIVPEPGFEPEFDASLAHVTELEEQLQGTLREYRRQFGCQEIKYVDSGKEIFLIQVPNKIVPQIPLDWKQMKSTSKVKRYWSPEVTKLVRELQEARETHSVNSDSLKQRLYAKFDADSAVWTETTKKVAEIDCIVSLVRASESLGSPLCRPEFLAGDQAFLEFKELRHPCFIPGGSSGTRDFIPNDVVLGQDGLHQIGLLTGANAAGKSTLLRMTGIAVLLAQIGCFVPAASARLVPVDCIMTRLGANDNIMQGKSTFFVELAETKRMLENATPKSLIILDELGRGGSSSDGFAIAEAVLHHIATHVQAVGFFATHYGTLGESFVHHSRIQPLRMGILVDEHSRKITFLYKLQAGRSNGSFGMHVAAMCGVPKQIVDAAEVAARDNEHTVQTDKRCVVPLGLQSDFSWLEQGKPIGDACVVYTEREKQVALETMFGMIAGL